jgi:hypothetical protein
MKKMGWNEGSGIGKKLQGISAPIEVNLLSVSYIFLFIKKCQINK